MLLSLCSAALPSIPSNPRHCLKSIKTLAESIAGNRPASLFAAPIESLRRGDWVKLICGASFEDVADVRNLSLVYTLAGVDCIDCAADASVVNAVNDGIDAALGIASVRRPWVMISVNDDRNDLHFRKAEFDPEDCPPDCSRPCEMVCPANAILLKRTSEGDEIQDGSHARGKLQGGVITERCYGCGRCLPVCPYDRIRAITYIRDLATTSALLKRHDVDAIEIHTCGRTTELFKELWSGLSGSIDHLKLVAVSLPDNGESTVATMHMIYSIMKTDLECYNLWQLDGRPMSGDIGRGATKEAVTFAARITSMQDRPDGFYQLAGGTNAHTIDSLKKLGLFRAKNDPDQLPKNTNALIGGIAYGGYARKIIGRVLRRIPSKHGHAHIEDYPELMLDAIKEAFNLVGPVKCSNQPVIQH
ncbi:RLI1 protein [Dioscorea alata]|uniref:RLI1 protein n=1 Tax=Dioscorea alata TaxID=55571 RepID=A0ACB7VVB5_DIOAL|nr:RLI1 protein [Dioscorea alata]